MPMPTCSRLLCAGLLTLAASAASADASEPVLAFDGAIGVDPLTAAGGVDAPNVVRGINPGGRAWVIERFDARIYDDARIVATGRGLLFSSGDVIGTRGPVANVAATLACGPANNALTFTTQPFPLDTAGDFKIRGTLSDDGGNPAVLPVPCDNPVLLIRGVNTAGQVGGWFAAGIPSRRPD